MAKWLVPPLKTVPIARLSAIDWGQKIEKEPVGPLESLGNIAIDRMLTKIREAGDSVVLMHGRSKFRRTTATEIEGIDEETPEVLWLYMVQLYEPESTMASLLTLRNKASQVVLKYTAEQIDLIERLTKKQSNSKIWFRFRTGRITASVFKRVCRTSISNPSISLINQICNPQNCYFYSPQTEYGKQTEKIALTCYTIHGTCRNCIPISK